jgi:anti-sigma factor ChrR (cupin superfamily)
MNIHLFLDDELRDLAAQYVLGTLSEAEARAIRLHLPACSTCRAEVDVLTRVGRELLVLAPATAPRPELWSRVAERIFPPDAALAAPAERSSAPRQAHEGDGEAASRSDTRRESPADAGAARPRASEVQIWKAWARAQGASSSADFTLVPQDSGPWEATSIKGIEARQLFIDRKLDRATFLVRMAPGTAYPAHVHGGPEECFVLEGDLKVGEATLRAGDYQRAETGSTHAVQSTERGCVLLLVSSLADEIVSD